jgi:hypothetical protein
MEKGDITSYRTMSGAVGYFIVDEITGRGEPVGPLLWMTKNEWPFGERYKLQDTKIVPRDDVPKEVWVRLAALRLNID